MSSDEIETHHLQCECSHAEHDVRLVLDSTDGDLWIEVQLNPLVRGWLARFWIAVNYLMGNRKQSRYGAYDTTLLRLKDYDKIRDLLTRSQNLKVRDG